MARVFLGNPPWSRPGFYGVRAGSRWPHLEYEGAEYLPFPFYLAYATALLEREGHTCLLVDSIGERSGEEAYVERCEAFRPDLIVQEVATASFPTDLAMARKVKARLPGVPIAFAGMHVDMYRPQFLKEEPAVSIVLTGEYEETLLELANHLGEEKAWSDIRGLNYLTASGEAVANERRSSIRDLDRLPWPARHHLPVRNYFDCPGRIPMPCLQMWASRGCPFRCDFCAWPQIMYADNKYRTRDPVNVVDEIEDCVKRYGMRSVYFDDDTFNIGKERMIRLAEEIRKRNLGLPWGCMARADTSDEETLTALKESGLAAIKFGVESADQNLVDGCGKRLDLDRLAESVQIVKRLGIKLHLTFTFGFPGETHKSIRDTIRLARKLNPESVQFSILTPYPGSRFFERMLAEGKIQRTDWEAFEGGTSAVTVTDELTSEDLEAAVCSAYREWERHKFFRAFREPGYFLKALTNPLRGIRHVIHVCRSYRSRVS